MPSHLESHLEEAIFAAKQQALSVFTQNVIVTLMQHGFNLEDLLTAIADYTANNDSWEAVTDHLEQASAELSKVRRRSR